MHAIQMKAMTPPEPGLSDPAVAAVAWARYRAMMRWMVLAAIVAVAAALGWLHHVGGLVTVHVVIATIAGVFFTVLLGAALMMAVFLSSGSGHDESVGKGLETPDD